ncbi:MAG: glycosyl hydrolase 115 family protein [Lentisphaeria bacterium]|nr:glycosyl hydrolase 115 family protein [Lentisphaeria bacterium]
MSFLSLRKLVAAAAVCCAAINMMSADLQAQTVDHTSVKGNYRHFLTLVNKDSRVRILVDDADYDCVKKAADMFCSDLKAITGREDAAKVENELRYSTKESLVVVGTLGHSKFIDRLVEKKKIDVSQIKGKWEHTLTACVRNPFGSGEDALVIAGSDRRAAAFGLMKLSEDCGMSPWNWWADVPPNREESHIFWLGAVDRGEVSIGRIDAPKVKYRGIFINDEDWALHEWAKNNFEKDGFGRIGPKTNEKIFELMLRLRMNYFWPAMHDVSVEFGAVPENPVLADRYGIVMGASHCEPMLRNNCHWKKEDGPWNYVSNQAKIDAYWQESVDQRGDKEAVWTLGIRGIHDSSMQGANTMDEKKALVSKAIANQRAMLEKGVSKEWGPVAQCFVPYKEVLAIYDAGLEVPEDVTLVWVDDNYGYIRRLSNPEEQKRSGGSGVYYHISYYGGPHSYCELNTTPPGLMYLELLKAYNNNTRDLWVLNVGDLKLMEIGVDYFARLAWDPTSDFPGQANSALQQERFFSEFLDRSFRGKIGPDACKTLERYFSLGFFRKPEEMSLTWAKDLPDAYIPVLKNLYEELIRSAKNAEEQIRDDDAKDAWFELAGYQAQYLGNAGLIFLACREASKQNQDLRAAAEPYIRAIDENRERFGRLHDGKWAGFLPDTVRNRTTNNEWWTHMQWPWNDRPGPHWGNTDHKKGLESGLALATPDKVNNWLTFRGIGELDLLSGKPGMPSPDEAGNRFCTFSTDVKRKDMKKDDQTLEYTFKTEKAEANALIDFLPSYELYPGSKARIAVLLNGEEVQTVSVPHSDSLKEENGPRSTLILDNFARVVVPLKNLRKGENKFTIRAVDPGVSVRAVYLPNK